MQKIKLRPRQLGFLIGTRAALAAGLGLLLSGKLPAKARKVVGAGLVAIGVATTVPALRAIRGAT